MKEKLDLMQWKNIERESEQQLRDTQVTQVIAGELLAVAKKNISRLGGKTSEEEEAEAKKKL